jgi:hypothetical protein
MTDLPQETHTLDVWEPLPVDVIEWMGMDEAMVPFALDVAR